MAQTCGQGMEGNQSCVAGERMECTKAFDQFSHEFKYRLSPVNSAGLVFSATTPFYKMTYGYTPATCSGTNTAREASSLSAS